MDSKPISTTSRDGDVPTFQDARNMAEQRGRWSTTALPHDAPTLTKRTSSVSSSSEDRDISKIAQHRDDVKAHPLLVGASEKKMNQWGRRTHSFLLYDPPLPTFIGLGISLAAIVLFSTSTFISALSRVGWMALVGSMAIVNTYVGITYLINQKTPPNELARKVYEQYHISPKTVITITDNIDEFVTVVLEEGSKILLVENRWRSLKWACGLYATSWLCAKMSGTTALSLALITLFTVPKLYSTYEMPIKRNLKQAQEKLDAGYTRVQQDIYQYADATTARLKDIRDHSDVYVQKAVDSAKDAAVKTVEASKDVAAKTSQMSAAAAAKANETAKAAAVSVKSAAQTATTYAAETAESAKQTASHAAESVKSAAQNASTYAAQTATSAKETATQAAQNASAYAADTVTSAKETASKTADSVKEAAQNAQYYVSQTAESAKDSAAHAAAVTNEKTHEAARAAEDAAKTGAHDAHVYGSATKVYAEGLKEGVQMGHNLGKHNMRVETEALKEE